jgi:Cu2+-containing amine oxidase
MVNASSSKSNGDSSSTYAHPLDPLSISEIQQTVEAVRSYIAKGAKAPKPIHNALFNSIDLREPYKYAVLAWSGLFNREEIIDAGGDPDAPLTRQAEVGLAALGPVWC